MEPIPLKKRRRWLIVASVLVLVSAVSWWNWPRGDVRFVGKWRTRMEQVAPAQAKPVRLRRRWLGKVRLSRLRGNLDAGAAERGHVPSDRLRLFLSFSGDGSVSLAPRRQLERSR
jgi:hypothetical protein